MGKATGFLEFERQERTYEAPQERVKTWKEFVHAMPAMSRWTVSWRRHRY